jgi:hypothetical protein
LAQGLSAPRFALGVPHPFKAFDALFGLTAIALGQPGLSASIAAEVRLLHRLADAGGRLSSPHIRQTYADAIAVIEGTADWAGGDAEEIEALGWAPEAPTGLATEPALRTDPAIITPSSHLLAFVILPAAFATPVAQFNPARRLSRRSRPTTPSDVIAQVLRGAWGGPSPPANRVLH